ncbi:MULTISPECIES: hypothetical protein [unclassified Curtobacterium]|uniref:hypothetical protein n=1 Tax=unclassified Curtobacterium TaxID=257496 RepID=UPI00226B25C1|nr:MULTISPECIES: hypothetical protein [unclassified Curtobacterium]
MSPAATTPRIGRGEVVSLLGVTAVFVLLLVTWAYVNPALHGPDEVANVDAVLHLAMGQSWPHPGDLHYVQGLLAQNVPNHLPPAAERGTFAAIVGDGTENELVNPMSQHPPTWFLVQAIVAHVIDFASHRWDLVVLVWRLVDVVVAAPLPLLVWAAVRRATRSPRLAVSAAVALLAVPQLLQLTSSVSVWVPVITAGALATWLGVRVLTGDRSWWTALALGGALAVGTAVMAGGVMAVPFALLAVLLARSDGAGGRALGVLGRVLRAVVVLAVPLVTTGWWYLAQLVRTGTPQPDSYPAVVLRWPRLEGPDGVQFAGVFWNGLSNSFWGQLGRYEWPLSPILVDTFTVLALTVLVWGVSRRSTDRRVLAVAGVFPLTALVVVVVRDWATYAGHLGVNVNQGRFLFPAVAALLVTQAVAWQALVVRREVRVRLARAALVVAPVVVVAALGLLYAGTYEELVFRVSAAGKQTLWGSLPLGRAPLGALVVAVGVLGAATIVIAWRWFGSTRTVGSTDDTTATAPTTTGTGDTTATADTTTTTTTDPLPDSDAGPTMPARLPADR